VIWDNHSNIPQAPLKVLAGRLVGAANAPGEPDPLDRVLLGVCTGSVACAAALKIQLKVFEQQKGRQAVPVVVTIAGNYHGTDMVPQFMRGLWPWLGKPVEVASVPPNDVEALQAAFRKHGEQVAGFWAEPVMMNREAIALETSYLQCAREGCDRVGALMCLDEIQTCFWRPELFDFRALRLRPDLVVIGKGMTAGFHPLSGLLFKHRHDVLEQYDAISTNGSAALPAFVALCSMAMIDAQAPRIARLAQTIETEFAKLAAEFPQCLQAAHGRGFLAGLKFRRVSDALAFQRRLLEAGLWTRVHAYHAGHSTLLTKLGLLADETVVNSLVSQFRCLLQETATHSA
jgi:acetylornithine/succinyldiaminopimelate/putrescine aminotransferase